MKMTQIVLVALTAMILAGCGGGEQDPLANQPDNIKNGEYTKPKPVDEIAEINKSKFLFIERMPYFNVENNTEAEVIIRGKSLYPNSRYRLTWINADMFPGATYEEIEGDPSKNQQALLKINWTPKEYITIDTFPTRIDVVLKTVDLEKADSLDDSLPVFIYRKNFDVPKVLGISGMTGDITEGESRTVQVTIEDRYAQRFPDEIPELMFFSGTGFNNINGAPYLTVRGQPKQDEQDLGKWVFDVDINLRNTEVTRARTNASFFVAAVSKNGKKSAPLSASFFARTSLSQPITTWVTDVDFKVGADNKYDFLVYDVRNEGFLSTQFQTNCNLIVGQPRCSCRPQIGTSLGTTSVNVCTVHWKIPDGVLSEEQSFVKQEFKFTGIAKSPIANDTTTVQSNFVTTIRMVK